ncbi:hypothetical protein [Bacillus sp. SG-1]|uniref:hypothetical protein n=1 Tax=Bacillus sp. SG-1 TaxID=161544 RepID=UPI000305545A|nr:hypothetical protein [Bacillus sp. SG-1]
MKSYIGIIALIPLLLLAGCTNDETVSVEGEIHSVDQENKTIIVYVEDELTKSQRQTMDFDQEEKNIEAFLVRAEDAAVTGEVTSFDDLQTEQKVTVEIKGKYEKELVTVKALFDEEEELPDYHAEKVTVNPYSKEDLIEEMTVEKGKYGLYIYNPKPNEEGVYSPPETMKVFHSMTMYTSADEVKNTQQLLELYEDSPTYIVTNHEGIIFKTDDEAELNEFAKTLGEKENN